MDTTTLTKPLTEMTSKEIKEYRKNQREVLKNLKKLGEEKKVQEAQEEVKKNLVLVERIAALKDRPVKVLFNGEVVEMTLAQALSGEIRMDSTVKARGKEGEVASRNLSVGWNGTTIASFTAALNRMEKIMDDEPIFTKGDASEQVNEAPEAPTPEATKETKKERRNRNRKEANANA